MWFSPMKRQFNWKAIGGFVAENAENLHSPTHTVRALTVSLAASSGYGHVSSRVHVISSVHVVGYVLVVGCVHVVSYVLVANACLESLAACPLVYVHVISEVNVLITAHFMYTVGTHILYEYIYIYTCI